MSDSENVWLKAEEQDENQRIDKYLARVMPEISRSYFQKLLKDGGVFIDGKVAKASDRLQCGDEIYFQMPKSREPDIEPEDLSLDMFKGYAYLFIEGYLVQDHDMILRAIELAKEAGLQVCLDMASYNIVEGDLEFFSLLVNKYVDIVFANEEEAKAFTGKEPEEALDIIAKMCSIAIVKVGARGSLIRKGTEMVQVQAAPVEKVVDTTGAGDYFAAGFLYGLTCGYSLEKCGKIGSLLSKDVIQVVGTELQAAQWEKIKEEILLIN